MEATLEKTLSDFVSVTARSKVVLIVPLFGYWTDKMKETLLDEEVLKASLDRIVSSVHQLYIIFVGEPKRMSVEIQSILAGRAMGGNTQGVAVESGSTYVDYVKAGMDAALHETDAQFIIIVNPWGIVKQNGLDTLVDRINRADAKIICGYDLHKDVSPETFDSHFIQIPKEERALTFDFAGMTRQTAEMFELDPNYKTHKYIARDSWQQLYAKGFEVITTQRVLLFMFELNWENLESKEQIEQDKQYFINKWHFDAQI